MGYQEAKTSDAFRLTDHINKPLEAYYLGSRLIDTDKYGEQHIHKFKKKDGSNIEVFGFDLLNRKLEAVPKLCMCKVTYLGKKNSTKKKDQNFHDCEVLYDLEVKLNGEQTKEDDLPF
jgi:hypothetical protein